MSKLQIYDKYITSPILVKDDWLYHCISYNRLESYLKKGILPKIKYCSIAQMIQKKESYNGLFYVSLTTRDPNIEYSAYPKFIEPYWALIINPNISVIKTTNVIRENKKMSFSMGYISNTILGLFDKRYSRYDNEYQVKGTVLPKDIIGIKIPSEESPNEENWRLCNIDNIFNELEACNVDLPLIDVEKGMIISRR